MIMIAVNDVSCSVIYWPSALRDQKKALELELIDHCKLMWVLGPTSGSSGRAAAAEHLSSLAAKCKCNWFCNKGKH